MRPSGSIKTTLSLLATVKPKYNNDDEVEVDAINEPTLYKTAGDVAADKGVKEGANET